MVGSHLKTAGLILDELKPTGAGGKEGTTEARYFGSFKVADDGTYWVDHLPTSRISRCFASGPREAEGGEPRYQFGVHDNTTHSVTQCGTPS
eukprot:6395204-Prymnesium_polylepis.1